MMFFFSSHVLINGKVWGTVYISVGYKLTFFTTNRAAFMCGREPNFALSEEEKQELWQYKWDEFLAITRSAITNKSKSLRIS